MLSEVTVWARALLFVNALVLPSKPRGAPSLAEQRVNIACNICRMKVRPSGCRNCNAGSTTAVATQQTAHDGAAHFFKSFTLPISVRLLRRTDHQDIDAVDVTLRSKSSHAVQRPIPEPADPRGPMASCFVS